MSEKKVADAKLSIGIGHEALEHRSVGQQEAAAQAIVQVASAERFNGFKMGDGFTQVIAQRSVGPFGQARRVFQFRPVINKQRSMLQEPAEVFLQRRLLARGNQPDAIESIGILGQP